MTGILVSVRNTAEAEIALAGGADLIDVKEPLRGALGAAEPQVWDDVLRAVGGRVPTSVALGELFESDGVGSLFRPDDDPLSTRVGRKRLPTPSGFTFAKLGLAGCAALNDWAERWQQALARLPAGVQPVAVIYADHENAHSPPPNEILDRAKAAGCSAVLVDTFDKSQGGLLDHLSFAEVATLVRTCRDQRMRCVLAGKLTADTIEQLLPLAPDYVGVRGAACCGSRTERLDLGRVKSLAHLVHYGAKKMAAAGA